MTTKSEEQIAKDKAAVEAMRNAKSNMDHAIARVSDLEIALGRAVEDFKRLKKYVSGDVYTYGNERTSVHSEFDAAVKRIQGVL